MTDYECEDCKKFLDDDDIDWVDEDDKDLNIAFKCQDCGTEIQVYLNLREE